MNATLNASECVALLTDASNVTTEDVGWCRVVLERRLARPFVMAWWQQLAWGSVFGAMVTVAVAGNLIVLWIVAAHRRMRTSTNYFLLNLSVADLMMATFNVVFNFVFMLESHWPFGAFYCAVNNFIASVTVACSVFTIAAMSVDRYIAIVLPLRPRLSRRRILGVIGVIWSLAGLLSLPQILYSSTADIPYISGENRVVCFLHWPDGAAPRSRIDYVYNVIFLLMTYIVPIIFMAVTYCWMGSVLWGSKGIGEMSAHQREVVRSKRRVVRMLIVVVALFTVCWLPYHTYFLYTYHHENFLYTEYVQHVFLAFYWLAMSNSMYNPVVYYWMNTRFRAYFQSILCWGCHRQKNLDSNNQTWSSTGRTMNLSLRRSHSNGVRCHNRPASFRYTKANGHQV